MLRAIMTMLPLLLWTANVRSDDQFGQDDNQFNLTTISPDDETIDSLIEAVDSAVESLQNAVGATTDSSFNYYDLEDYNEGDEETSEDYFTGDNDYGDRDVYDDQDIDAYDDDPGGDYSIVEGEEEELDYEDEEEEDGGDYTIDEDGEVVVEESQLTEATFNRTVRKPHKILT